MEVSVHIPYTHMRACETVCISCSVVSDSLRPHGLYPTRLLCQWDSPGKNTGVGCHFLLQWINQFSGLCPWQVPGGAVAMQDITTEGNWVQGIRDLTVLFFTTACEPTITSLQKIENKSVCFHGTPRGTQRFLFGPTLPPAECKYQFQAWGECDLNTALKTRTGSLKRALHNADCQKTVTISKPCGKLTKSKPQGRFCLWTIILIWMDWGAQAGSSDVQIFHKEVLDESP